MNLRDESFRARLSSLMIHGKADEAVKELDKLSSQMNREALSVKEKGCYDCVVRAMRDPDRYVPIEAINPDEYNKVVVAVRCDHPFLFGLKGYYRYHLDGGEVIDDISFERTLGPADIGRIENGLVENVLNFCMTAGIDTLDSTVRIFDKIHSQFSTTTDWRQLDKNRYGDEMKDLVEHTIVGPMVMKNGVCSGLSYAFCGMLQGYGIKSCVTSGHSKKSPPSEPDHAWNIVELGNGISGHIDIQNSYSYGRSRYLESRYHGFLISDLDMSEKYSLNPHPSCGGATSYYFDMFSKHAITNDDVRRIIHNNRKNPAVDMLIEPRHGKCTWVINVLQDLAEEYDLRDFVYNDRENIITVKIGAYNEDRQYRINKRKFRQK